MGTRTKNLEGYSDPTATEVIEKISMEEERFHRLLHTIFYLCDIAGFQIEGRRRQYECIDGRYLDHYSLAMLASDYRLRLPS